MSVEIALGLVSNAIASFILLGLALIVGFISVLVLILVERYFGLIHGCHWMGLCELAMYQFFVGTLVYGGASFALTRRTCTEVVSISDHIENCIILYAVSAILLFLFIGAEGQGKNILHGLVISSFYPIVVNAIVLLLVRLKFSK